jgi:hypothetical protein
MVNREGKASAGDSGGHVGPKQFRGDCRINTQLLIQGQCAPREAQGLNPVFATERSSRALLREHAAGLAGKAAVYGQP